MFINIEFHLSLCFYSKYLYFCNKYRLDGLHEKIMIYKTCAKELVIPLILHQYLKLSQLCSLMFIQRIDNRHDSVFKF